MSLTIYGGAMGSSLRAHWAAREVGQTYETKSINIPAGENKTPEYLALNPTGQVPTLKDGNFVLTESAAIAWYLCDAYKPELLGSTPQLRARAQQWGQFVMLNIQPQLLRMAMLVWNKKEDPAVVEDAKTHLGRWLPILDGHLATHAYVAGEDFTVGDIIAATSLTYADVSGFDLTGYPNIVRWMEACKARPAFQSARA